MNVQQHLGDTHQPSKGRYPLKPLTLAVCAAILTLSSNAAVADDASTVASLQAQIEQLKSQLAASQRLANPAAPQASVAASSTAAAPAEDKPELKESLEDVVVTAKRKRKQQLALEKLKDTPRSVSVVSGEDLDQQQTTNMTDILRRVGNVNFNYGNPRTGSLTLRGITSGSNDTIDPSIGVVLDGVPIAYTPLANTAHFVDIDTIAVARGPQGTAGGKNSNIGQITVKSKAPSFNNEASVSLTSGAWNTLNATAIAGGTVIDDLLAWRGTFLREQSNGYVKNSYPDLQGRTSYGNTDVTYGRLQFLLTPTENLSAKLILENQPIGGQFLNGLTIKKQQPLTYSDGVAIGATTINAAPFNRLSRSWFTQSPQTFSPDQYFQNPVTLDNNGSIITSNKAITGEVDYKLGNLNLASITSYRSNWFSASNDEGTPFDITKDGGYITDYKQISQELRLQTSIDKLVDLTTGLYFVKTDNDSLSRTRYGSDAGAWFATGNGKVDNAQYGSLANNSDKTLNAPGNNLLRDSLNGLYKGTDTLANNKSSAWYGTADWHIAEPTTLTTGLRFGTEDRQTKVSNLVLDNGFGAGLNPVSVNNVQLGGFASDKVTGALSPTNSAAQLALANSVAKRYYGAASYAALSDAQKLQVANAKGLRSAQITGLFTQAVAEPFNDNIKSWNVSLKQKINDQLTVYGAVQYGEKAGISQINGSSINGGTSLLVKPERTTNYELGLRTDLLANTLTINADIFQSDIKNFQQTVSYLDQVLTDINKTPTYGSGPGNVGGVRIRGLEVDASYTGIQNLSLRFSGAYNDAIYTKFQYSGLASELDPALYPSGFYDVSGKTLANAPKLTGTIGADYTLPLVNSNKVFHAAANWRYTSKYNVDANSSQYGWVGGYGLLDLNIGIGRADGKYSTSLIIKNATDKNYHNAGWVTYNTNPPRWFGINVTGKY